MNYASADRYPISLPPGHRFPIEKYRLCRERLIGDGTIREDQLTSPNRCPRDVLARVHTQDWIERVFEGCLTKQEIRALGFPWSAELVDRSRCSVGGTLFAAERALEEGAGGNLAGGTHHAYADRGEGFCVFNDVAVAIRSLQRGARIRRAAVIDCDVHQGNGTAHIFRDDPDVFTMSIHARNNWPFVKEKSDLDVELDDGTKDAEYLEALAPALDAALGTHPDVVFYIAGVDPLASDRLGRLALSIAGLRARDELVLTEAKRRDIPIAISFGGGYSADVEEIAEAHANTYRVAEALFPG